MMTLVKQPNESILYDMDFTGLGRIGIDTIQSVQSVTTDVPGLTVVSSTTDGTCLAQFRLSGGVDGVTYKLSVVVVTNGGDTLEGNGNIHVKNL